MSAVKSRKCYLCGISGHISADCPTPNAKKPSGNQDKPAKEATQSNPSSPLALPTLPAVNTSRKCYNCGLTGHMSSACPLKKDESSKSSGGDGSSADSGNASASSNNNGKIEKTSPTTTPTLIPTDVVTSRKCYVCGLPGHLSSACPSKQANNTKSVSSSSDSGSDNAGKKCRNCGVNGHIEGECPLNVKAAKCDKCGKNHKSLVCPPPEPSSSSSTSTSAAVKSRKCYNCGQVGHMSSACPSKKPDIPTTSSSPSSPSSSSLPSSVSNNNNAEGDVEGNEFSLSPSSHKRKGDSETMKQCQSCKEMGHVARNCPNRAEKMSCYNCGGTDHFAKECPEEKKPDERVCHECGEQGHITRSCPQKKRFRKKDSGKDVCFVCEQSIGHLAKDCPSLEELKTSFAAFLEKSKNKEEKIELDECIRMLELCSRAMEINGALFVYNYLLEQKIALTEQIYDLLFHIYSRIGLAHSVLPALPKTGLEGEWPRDQLRRIVKSRKVGSMCAAAGENLPLVLQYLEANPRGAFENLFKLATFVAKGCGIGNKQARTAVLLLHSQGALAGAGVTFKKNKSKQPTGEEDLLRTALQIEFPDKQEKWDEWLSVLQAQDLITLKDLRELDAKDLDSLPVSAALRSGLRRLQAKALLAKAAPPKRKTADQPPKKKQSKKNKKLKSEKPKDQ